MIVLVKYYICLGFLQSTSAQQQKTNCNELTVLPRAMSLFCFVPVTGLCSNNHLYTTHASLQAISCEEDQKHVLLLPYSVCNHQGF